MIRCSHCGKLAPTGALSCQNCGMPLVSGGAGVAGAEQSELQELPAWLESLRAHERPVPSGQENRQPFSLDELVDEDSMPSWMRQDRRKVPESGNSDSFPAIPVVSAGINLEKQNTPSNGFQAGSLIDERSLPGWMRENQGQASGQPEAGQNVSANSLVDQQGLPGWIKDLSQAAQTPTPATNPYSLSAQPQTPTMNNYGLPVQPQTPTMNNYGLPVQTPITPPAVPGAPHVPSTPPTSGPPAAPAHGFSAHDLLDVQSMPGWLSGAQGPGQGSGSQPPTRPVPTSQGFSAGELIDQRSVPPWMRDLQGQERSDPQSAMGVPVNGMGQTMGMGQGTMSGEGMPAGSLLDKNSMPSWMQESQLSSTQVPQPTAQGMPTGSQLDVNATPSWMQESQLSSSTQTSQPTGQGMPARSLLDMNAMPSWMQESQLSGTQAPQPTAQGMPAGPQLDVNATPSWMQESQLSGMQAPQPTAQGMAAGSLIDMNSMPTWMQENQIGSSAQGTPQAGSSMAAGSLIDMNSMPAWMRASDNAQSGPGTGGRPGQIQARPVPSRPRNEIAQQEQSEVAANVFSSMLGVAASAPALPGQEPMQGTNLGVAQGQPIQSMPPFQQAQPSLSGWQQPAQPSLPGWQQPAQNQYNQGGQPQTWQMPGAVSNSNPASPPNAYMPANQAGSAGNWSQRANTPEQPAWGGYPTADKTALGATTGASKNNPNPGKAQSTETKKKGFFDSIRDFFYH